MGFLFFLLAILTFFAIWLICLEKIIAGNGLDTFRLDFVMTPATALDATYLMVFISDSLIMLAVIWIAIARSRHERRLERELEKLIYKRSIYRSTLDDSRAPWRKKQFPKKGSPDQN